MNMLYRVYYTIADLIEYIHETEPTLGFDKDILNPNPERIKLYLLKELYQFYSFARPCKKAVAELTSIIQRVDTLENEEVRIWVEENILFYEQNILLFGSLYNDENGEHEQNLYLPKYNLYIERKAFVPVIQYWYLMNHLYFGKYYLIKEERKFTEPNPQDYYYVAPDENATSDLEVVKQILRIVQL